MPRSDVAAAPALASGKHVNSPSKVRATLIAFALVIIGSLVLASLAIVVWIKGSTFGVGDENAGINPTTVFEKRDEPSTEVRRRSNEAPPPAVPAVPAHGALTDRGQNGAVSEVDVADVKRPPAPAPVPITVRPTTEPPANDIPTPVPPKRAVAVAEVPVAADPPETLPAVDPKGVADAVGRGVAYLKARQAPDGSWGGSPNQVGYAALAGLTLLECHVAAHDATVGKAAAYVRANLGNLTQTYDVAVAILFLDRLGELRDHVLTQGLALRLLAGQNESGGWGYKCPLLRPEDMQQLHRYLQSHRPSPPAPRAVRANQGADFSDPLLPPVATLLMPKSNPGATDLSPLGMPDLMAVPLPSGVAEAPGVAARPFKVTRGRAAPDQPNVPNARKPVPIRVDALAANLQRLPVVELSRNHGWLKTKMGSGDHSNTQFALLALWAARRHDVATEYPLLLAYQRFELVQAPDGGWGYRIGLMSTSTMDCVGLLALAMGHGAVAEAPSKKLESVAIQKGLGALGRFVGSPSQSDSPRVGMQNLYFLWSVERVAMLYGLRTIGGHDWYGWGAQVLLHNQQPDGHWSCGNLYPGATDHVDTCFALLFLKRSNLVPDLTENLRLNMVIRDPGAR